MTKEILEEPVAQSAPLKELDLQQFCSTDPVRRYLHKPFSLSGHTFATNGHILVRVPLRSSAPPPVDGKPRADVLFDKEWREPTTALPTFSLPPEKKEDCPHCDGEKHGYHACPSCDCVCEECDIDGQLSSHRNVSVEILGAAVAAQYAKMLQGLPDVRLAPPRDKHAPIPFSFAGGDGLLMPLRSRLVEHVKATSGSRTEGPAPTPLSE